MVLKQNICFTQLKVKLFFAFKLYFLETKELTMTEKKAASKRIKYELIFLWLYIINYTETNFIVLNKYRYTIRVNEELKKKTVKRMRNMN